MTPVLSLPSFTGNRNNIDILLYNWRALYGSSQRAPQLRELTCHTRSHSVTCHPAEVTFPPLPQPIKAGTRFSDPRGMQGWVDLVGLVTYQGGIPARRRSPIPAPTGLNVEQLRSCDERRYGRYHALNRQPRPVACINYTVEIISFKY